MAQINSSSLFTAPTFSFEAADQPTAWRDFYLRALDYLEMLKIKSDEEDRDKKGWTLIKLMFTGQDRQALQTLVENDTITEADQCTPRLALKAIQTALKDGEHYWHYRDEILSDIRQQPEEQVHTLSTRIINLVNNCNFRDQQTTETLKIMLLQHAIKYHEARDWIRLQDPTTLTYKALLQHCKQLEQCCDHFRKAQQKGRGELTTLANASVTHTSIHQDAITSHSSHNSCYRCGYSHVNRDCPAIGQRCFKCNRVGHFSHLCKARNTNNHTNSHRYDTRRSSHRTRSSRSRHNSRSSSRSSSRSPARSSTHHSRPRRYRSPTPHHVDTITITRPSAAPTNSDIEDNQTQMKKCKDRSPTPIPEPLFTFHDYSDTDYPESNVGTPVYAQYKGRRSTAETTTTTNASQDQYSSADSELPISDDETESSYTSQSEHTNFSSFQDHTTYIPRPPACNQPESTTEDEITSIPTQTRPIPPPRPSKATHVKQSTQAHPYTAPVRKSPLLPTPPASERLSNNTTYKQYITKPSASNNSNPTFTRPSPSYNRSDNQHIPRPSPSPPRYNTHPAFPGPAHYSHYLQHIPGPYTAFPPYLHQNFITGPYQQTPPIPAPYQQTPGHFPQRVYYVPIILPHYTI